MLYGRLANLFQPPDISGKHCSDDLQSAISCPLPHYAGILNDVHIPFLAIVMIVSSTPNIVKVNLTQLSNRFQICLSKTSIGFLSCTICLQTGTLLIIPDLLIFVHIIIQLFSAYIYIKKKLDKDDFAVHRKKKKKLMQNQTLLADIN